MYKPYRYCDWSEREPEKPFRKIVAKTRPVLARDWFLMDDPRILIHPLVLCPPIAKGKRYLLVERRWWGQRDVLKIGRAQLPHEGVNLARVRHTLHGLVLPKCMFCPPTVFMDCFDRGSA